MQGHAWLHWLLSSACQLTALTSYSQGLKPAIHKLKKLYHPKLSNPANHRLKKWCHPTLLKQPITDSRDNDIPGCYAAHIPHIRTHISQARQTSRESRGTSRESRRISREAEKKGQQTRAGDMQRAREKADRAENRDKSKAKDCTPSRS